MKYIQVTLKKSLNGATKEQKQSALCLGLRKIHQSRRVESSPTMLGQAKKIKHLLTVEEV